jgi:hypothetical protein
MREVGRLGGLRAPMTKLRKATRVDDELREKARGVLERALAGEDVPKSALDSARSLFSYRSDVPAPHERAHPAAGGAKIVSLVDLVRVAVEAGMVVAERGGPVVVDGRRVQREDPTLSRAQGEAERDEPPPAGDVAPEQALAQLVDDEAPKFDESAEAKLTRRYGDDTAEGYRG